MSEETGSWDPKFLRFLQTSQKEKLLAAISSRASLTPTTRTRRKELWGGGLGTFRVSCPLHSQQLVSTRRPCRGDDGLHSGSFVFPIIQCGFRRIVGDTSCQEPGEPDPGGSRQHETGCPRGLGSFVAARPHKRTGRKTVYGPKDMCPYFLEL